MYRYVHIDMKIYYKGVPQKMVEARNAAALCKLETQKSGDVIQSSKV